MIENEREQHAYVLTLDGGDALFSDRPLTQQSQGALIIEAMNLMGYDAMALGEGDLKLGVDVLRQRMEQASFPVLSANLHLAESGELFALPYTILELGGRKVGVIGLTGRPAELPSAFTIADPFTAAQQILPQVAEQADLVIILSHLGWTQNIKLAGISPVVDLIISGGAPMPGEQPYTAPSTGARLAQAESPTRGHAARFVGRWELTLSAKDDIVVNGWQSIPLDAQFADAPAVVELLQHYGGR